MADRQQAVSERQNYIRADQPANQALTVLMMRRIADWFDIADDETIVTVYPEAFLDEGPMGTARAWMWAALLIADMADIPSAELRKVANSILLGVQGEFAYRDHYHR